MTDESVDPLAADNIETNPSRPSQATLDAAAAGKTDTKTDGVTGSVPPEPIAEPAPAEPAPAKDATSYVLLSKDDSGFWSVEKTVEARSAEAAIRAWAEATVDENSLTFVAVPERSWNPVTVTVKTTKTLVLGEPS